MLCVVKNCNFLKKLRFFGENVQKIQFCAKNLMISLVSHRTIFFYFCALVPSEFICMISYIKKSLLKRCLEKHKASREKKLISLEKAQTIAILCQITDEESYKEVHALFSKLHSHNRTAWLMGYIDKKGVPYYCLPQLSADYFSKKNLNWYGKPYFTQLNDFLNKDFDILIDFSRKDLPPLRYILSTSKAKLIVGANAYAQNLYDVFIHDETEPDDLKLLKIIHNYLLKLTGNA